MNVKKVEFTKEEKDIIKDALQENQLPGAYKRLMALKLKAIDGKRSDETGKLVGLHATSVNRIVKRFKEEGIGAIVGKRHTHGNRYMTLEEEKAFLAPFQSQGKVGQIIEVTEIHRAYEETVGHPVTRSAIYYMLHKHGWRKVMPRGKHPKKASEAEIAAYKKNRGDNPKLEKEPAETASDVSGRGWIWTDQ